VFAFSSFVFCGEGWREVYAITLQYQFINHLMQVVFFFFFFFFLLTSPFSFGREVDLGRQWSSSKHRDSRTYPLEAHGAGKGEYIFIYLLFNPYIAIPYTSTTNPYVLVFGGTSHLVDFSTPDYIAVERQQPLKKCLMFEIGIYLLFICSTIYFSMKHKH
jgi:hypothetical protein